MNDEITGRNEGACAEISVADLDCLNLKLKTYYVRNEAYDTYGFYDRRSAANLAARRVEAAVIALAATAANELVCSGRMRKFRVNKLLARLIERCATRVHAQRRSAAGFSVSASSRAVMNYLSRQVQAVPIV